MESTGHLAPEKLRFSAHNIMMANGKTTMTDRSLLADSAFMGVLRRILADATGSHAQGNKNLKLVDLACMEGGYSIEFARMGFDVTGIDARKFNLVKASYAWFKCGLNNPNFIADDVRNLHKYGPFDITCCLGILYHLNDPAEFLRTLFEQTNNTLILHSFYAPERTPGYLIGSAIFNSRRKLKKIFKIKKKLNTHGIKTGPEIVSYIQHIKTYQLGKLTMLNGYKGRWHSEWEKSTDKEDIEGFLNASYNNPRSFWFCKDDMVRALYDAGFNKVEEIKDDIGDLGSKYPSKFYGRSLLVATK